MVCVWKYFHIRKVSGKIALHKLKRRYCILSKVHNNVVLFLTVFTTVEIFRYSWKTIDIVSGNATLKVVIVKLQ